jgi:hypothetical protein
LYVNPLTAKLPGPQLSCSPTCRQCAPNSNRSELLSARAWVHYQLHLLNTACSMHCVCACVHIVQCFWGMQVSCHGSTAVNCTKLPGTSWLLEPPIT